MIISSRLLILQTTKVGDKSLVLHTLSSQWGRRSFIVSAGKGMAMYLPMNILDAEIMQNEKSSLWRLRGMQAVHPLNGIRSSIGKNSITLFMSEVLYRIVRDGAFEEGLFEWCERSVLTLDALESDWANFHIWWLLELCGALGFSPCSEDLAPFAGQHFPKLQKLLGLGFGGFMLEPMNGEERNTMAQILLDYIGFHSDCKVEIRSLKVLRELFS